MIETSLNGGFRVKSSATWVTSDEEEVKDPTFERVLGEYVVIRPISLSNKIKASTDSNTFFETPENTVEREGSALTVGRVVGIGEEAGKRPGVSKPSIGDYVLFPKYGGHKITQQSVKVVFIPDDAILAVITKEDAIESLTSKL